MKKYIIFDGEEIKGFIKESETIQYIKEWIGFGKPEYEEEYDMNERDWIEKLLKENCTDLEYYDYNIGNLFGDNNEAIELYDNDDEFYIYRFKFDGKKYITDGVILKREED